MTTYKSLALRGLAAGGIAGVASALVQLLVTEIPIRAALAVEEAREPAGETAGHSHDEELVSRGAQIAGGMLGVVIVGIAVGLVFATAYALSKRWFVDRPPFSRSVAFGVAVFGAVALLPWVKYPANPPAVGDPETVNYRTALYLGVVVAGLLIVWGASWLAERLHGQSHPVQVTSVLLARGRGRRGRAGGVPRAAGHDSGRHAGERAVAVPPQLARPARHALRRHRRGVRSADRPGDAQEQGR